MAKVTCFFSTKGGTGRSVALANTAALMARDGHKVGCIDFDVLAPGLVSMFGCEGPEHETTSSVLDLLMSPDDASQVASAWIDAGEHIKGIGRGLLFLMPARHEPKDKMERATEQEIWTVENMQLFYRNYIEGFNIQRLEHIFVDCRSGLTNESMCGLSLSVVNPSDRIVAFFRLDPQSRSGIHRFLKYCEEYSFRRKPILVATNVPTGTERISLPVGDFDISRPALDILQPFAKRIQRDFGIELTGLVSHEPELIIDHRLTVLEHPDSAVSQCYSKLYEKLAKV